MKNKAGVMDITSNQLRLVQTVMGKIANDRDTRLEILSDMCQRPIGSTKELTQAEANMVVKELGGTLAMNSIRRKQHLKSAIYHLSMKIDFLNMRYPEDDYDTRMMNCAKVDGWLQTHGVVKKPVGEMTTAELGKVIGQLKAIVGKV